MSEIAQPPRREAPPSPEPLRFQEGLVGLQTRLLITTPEALNPDSTLPVITRDALGSFGERSYDVFNNASTGERQDYWRGKEGDVFDAQKRAWTTSTVTTFTNEQAQRFFQSDQGKAWSETFAKLGITTQGFNQQAAEQLYSTYFTDGKSDIKKFVKDVIEKQADQNLDAIQWIANIFGKESSEVVTQLLDAEKKLKDQPEQLVQEANNNQRINHLKEKENQLLEFLSGIRKEATQPASQEASQNLEIDEGLVAGYKVFQDALHPKTDLVYYPACNVDISPSRGFPNSRVLYLDINKEAVVALKNAGLEAYDQSALEYKPDNPVDVLILLNPAISSDVPSQHVAQGGYVLCNDYHRTATDLRGNKDFELIGIIKKQRDGDYILDSENPDDYWKQVDSDEELQRIDPFSYKQIAEYTQKIWGIDQNIVQEHKKLLDLIKNDPAQAKQLLISRLGVSNVDFLDGNVLMTSSDGRSLVLPVLPRKKGHMDDTFVFKRISKQPAATPAAPEKRDIEPPNTQKIRTEPAQQFAVEKEQFVQTLAELRKIGTAAELEHQKLKKTYGEAVANDVGMAPELKPTREALSQLLSAVPGIELNPQAKDTIDKASVRSVIVTSHALAADVLREGTGLVEVGITFPDSKDGVATIKLGRVANKQGVDIKLRFTPDGIFLGGSIDILDIDGDSRLPRGSLKFDAQGSMQEVSGKMRENTRDIKQLNITKVIHSVTTAEELSQPFNVQQILSDASLQLE